MRRLGLRYQPPDAEPGWVRPPFVVEDFVYRVHSGDHRGRVCRILLESPRQLRVVVQFEDGAKVVMPRRSLRRRK